MCLATPAPAASSFIRVPQDRPLASALAEIGAGGVIEIAAGTYAAPAAGFTIRNPGRSFTVRAAAGATVVLDGQGQHRIVRLENGSRARGGRIVFQRLLFRNGAASTPGFGGAVTLSQAEAEFHNCSFEDNRADAGTTGGGAIKARDNSALTLVASAFLRNSSRNRGGAVVVRDSTLMARRVWFADNRTNLPGHSANSSGGALYLLSAKAEIFDSLFERNQAGWVGGAIYAFGSYDQPETRLDLTRSVLRDNRALPDVCCAIPGDTTGGAVHAENRVLVRLHQTRALDNRAHTGAGLSSFRAQLEVHASVLRGNHPNPGEGGGIGGAIAALSADGDPAVANRPAAVVIVANSLVQGGVAETAAPQLGGCLLAAGDTNRMYGENGITANGGLAENRARVEISDTLLVDCDAARSGGGLYAVLAAVTLAGSLVIGSDARGPDGAGGGLAVSEQSLLRVKASTFGGNSAQRQGGALLVSGSTLEVSASNFFGNAISPGAAEALSQSRGAAIFATPQVSGPSGRTRNVDGTVASSLFSQNDGVTIWDVDPAGGPINDVRYQGNRFFSTAHGDRVYVDTLAAPTGANTAGLNALVVFRSGRPSTDKSTLPNQALLSAPAAGAVLAAPTLPAIAAGPSGAAPVAASEKLLGYAWSGSNASLAGVGLPARFGVLSTGAQGTTTLSVNGAPVAAVPAGDGRCSGGPFLCLNGDRFRVSVDWKSGATSGSGRAVQLTADTGSFWFFDPANVELVVKVLDARAISGFYWVFYAGLTDREFTMTVVDLSTGATRVYRNPAGRLASAGDTAAFPAGAIAAATEASGEHQASRLVAAAGSCAPSPTRLCLSGGRVAVELTWKPPAGAGGIGQAMPLTGDTGTFWFTQSSNIEVIIKVLDGRPVNGHFWLFSGALSNLEYRIKITDTVTGASRTYTNPQGTFASFADTTALQAN